MTLTYKDLRFMFLAAVLAAIAQHYQYPLVAAAIAGFAFGGPILNVYSKAISKSVLDSKDYMLSIERDVTVTSAEVLATGGQRVLSRVTARTRRAGKAELALALVVWAAAIGGPVTMADHLVGKSDFAALVIAVVGIIGGGTGMIMAAKAKVPGDALALAMLGLLAVGIIHSWIVVGSALLAMGGGMLAGMLVTDGLRRLWVADKIQ